MTWRKSWSVWAWWMPSTKHGVTSLVGHAPSYQICQKVASVSSKERHVDAKDLPNQFALHSCHVLLSCSYNVRPGIDFH